MPWREYKVEILLALVIVVICAPGVVWWIGTGIALFTGKRPW
jgi:hypothetical protein